MMPAYPLVLIALVAAAMTALEQAWPVWARRSVAVVGFASVAAILVVILPRTLAAGGPRLAPEPPPPWVTWAAEHTPRDALIVGNLSFDYNFYLRRPVVEFSSNRYGISKFDCRAIATLLRQLNLKPVYFILRADRDTFDPRSFGRLYGPMLERLLNGEAVLPLRPLVRQPRFAAFEVLNSDWPCQ